MSWKKDSCRKTEITKILNLITELKLHRYRLFELFKGQASHNSASVSASENLQGSASSIRYPSCTDCKLVGGGGGGGVGVGGAVAVAVAVAAAVVVAAVAAAVAVAASGVGGANSNSCKNGPRKRV